MILLHNGFYSGMLFKLDIINKNLCAHLKPRKHEKSQPFYPGQAPHPYNPSDEKNQ
jgi:hypothetical protein